jgi:hypothetical protein
LSYMSLPRNLFERLIISGASLQAPFSSDAL